MKVKQRLNESGVGHIVLVLIILIIGVVGFAGWRVWEMQDEGDSIKIVETGDFKRENNILFQAAAHNMEVVKLPDGSFRAYFHEGPGAIKSAISNDEGKTFALEEGVRVQGSVPATLQLSDGRWRMYYSNQGQLVSAISNDGLSFSQEPGVRLEKGKPGELDAYGITHPSIVKLPDDSFRMYYDGQFKQEQGPHWRIMSASSKDGLTWIKDNDARIPVDTDFGSYEANLSFSCHVQFKDGKYVMYFSSEGNPMSASGIWRAVSTDGVNFTVEESPVLGRDPEFGDDEDSQTTGGPKGVPQDPYVIQTSQGERLFYWTSNKGYLTAIHL